MNSRRFKNVEPEVKPDGEEKVSRFKKIERRTTYIAGAVVVSAVAAVAIICPPNTLETLPSVILHNRIYYTQISTTLNSNYSNLSYTIKAEDAPVPMVALINGVTKSGWWYQVGLGIVPFTTDSVFTGSLTDLANPKPFNMQYEVWNNNKPISNANYIYFSGSVDRGNNIKISLSIRGKIVRMSAVDVETGASASATYPDHGGEFIGNNFIRTHPLDVASGDGLEFTGPMLEIKTLSGRLKPGEGSITFSDMSKDGPSSNNVVYGQKAMIDQFYNHVFLPLSNNNYHTVFFNQTVIFAGEKYQVGGLTFIMHGNRITMGY